MQPFAEILLRDVLLELRLIADPLVRVTRGQASLFRFFSSFGWNLEAMLGADLTQVAQSLNDIREDLDGLVGAVQGDSETQIARAAGERIRALIARSQEIYPHLLAAAPASFDDATLQALAQDTIEHLLTLYFARRMPVAYQLATLAGVVVTERAAPIHADGGNGALLRYPIERAVFRPRAVVDAALNPLFDLVREINPLELSGPEALLDALREALEKRVRMLYLSARGRGLDGMRVQLDHTSVRLVGGKWLPFPETGSQPIRIELDEVEYAPVVTIDSQAWKLEWLGEGADKRELTLLELGGANFFLASDSTAAVPERGLILSEQNGVLQLDVVGGIGVRFGLDVLSGVDGDAIQGQALARLSYRWGERPALKLDRLVIEGRLHLGGADGLLIEEARLELGEMDFPPPAPTAARPLPFDVTVSGKLVLPGENVKLEVEARYEDGTWSVKSSGSVRFDNGVELLPMNGEPVLELEAQPAAGRYRFAAAGVLEFPQAGNAGAGRLMLSGALALRMANRLPQVDGFHMAARVENWRLSSELTLRTLAVSLGHSASRFTAKLAAAIPFSDGFEIELLDAVPAGLAASATLDPGLVIERNGNRLDFRVTGGVRLRIPADVLSGGDGDKPVTAEASGRLSFSSDPAVLPALSNLAFALRAERLHLGGAEGLIIEDAAVVATSVDRLLALGSAPHPTLSFSGKVICPVNAPEGEVALKLKGARFIFERADRLPRFEFADNGELGFESADLGGLPLEITQGAVRFKDGARALPHLIKPDNLAITMGARLKLDFAGSAGVMGEIDKVTVELKHGRPCLTLDGASAGVDNLSLGVMKMSGALGFHNLQDPLNIQLEGTLGGSMYGSGVKALVAIKLENGLPMPLGVCLDVSAGPSGIPLVYGFVIVGAAGGISYANTNADPCDFRTYTRSRKPISSGRTLESKRPEAFDGCPCECPPPSLNILCQPHPGQDQYPGRVILKFSSIDESFWSSIALPGGSTLGAKLRQIDEEIGNRLAAATSSFDPKAEAQRAADAAVDGANAAMQQMLPALNPANLRPLPPAELRAQFDRLVPILQAPARYWSEQMRRVLANELEIVFARAKSGLGTGRRSVYDVVQQQLYRGLSCPDETLQVTGTFSYTGVSFFLSVTGGVNISTAGSMGVIGYLNVLSIPIGQLRAFVTATGETGDIEPSLCGDLRFELGPLYLGQISLAYRCPGCVTNLAGTVVKFGSRLGADVLRRVIARLDRKNHPFALRAGFDPARPETVLATLEATEASQFVAQVLSDLPELTPADAQRAVQFLGAMAGDLWAGFNPRIELCGKVAPKLFGLPLGGELVKATGLIEKDHIEVEFGFSPLYLLGRLSPIADMFSGMDAARMGVAMSFPTVEQLIIDGLTGRHASQEKFEQYLNKGLGRLLQEAVFTFSYQFFPLGMKLADGQGRAVMPYLTPHPKSTASTWKNPDKPAASVPADKRPPARRTVLFAALDRGLLADIHWTGAVNDVIDLPAGTQDLQLQRDYFPHGGLLGAGKLQVPRLLWDAPPLELLGRIFGGTQWMDRLRAFIELMRDWVLATREAGTLALYIPAPNPPGPLRDAPGENLRKVIDSLVELDPKRLMPDGRIAAGDLYSLELSFFEGYLAGRLLGLYIGRADIHFVPPSSAGGASELRAIAQVSADARLRQWVKEAKLELVVSNAPADRMLAPLERKPIEQLFGDLLNRAQIVAAATTISPAAAAGIKPATGPAAPAIGGPGTAIGGPGTASLGIGGLGGALGTSSAATAVPPAARALLDEAQKAMAERLPKVYLSAAVSLQVPPELAAFLDAGAADSAELRAYSPWYDSSAQGNTPDIVARRNGGLCISGDLTFKLGTLWQFKTKAELAAYLPANIAQRARVVGQAKVGAVSGLKFLGLVLPLGNASLAFDSDPAAGQPLLTLRGDLTVLGLGALRLEPLSGPALLVAFNALRTGNAAAVSLSMPASRLRLPCVSTDTPIEVRPAPGQSEVVLSSAGGTVNLSAPNGLKLLAPNGAVVLQISGGAGSGTVQFDATGSATLTLSLPAGLQASLFPGDAVLRRDFGLTQALDVSLRSDGTFGISAKLPPLVLENGLFRLHGAAGINEPLSASITQQEIKLLSAARFALQVPGAVAQTAVLDALSIRVDGALSAGGSKAVVELPGLLKSSAGSFSFARQGPIFRLKLADVQLTFGALPGLATRWNLELGTSFLYAQCTATGALCCGFGTRLSIDAVQWAVQATGYQSISLSAKSGSVKLLGTSLALSAGGAVSLTLASNGTISGQLAASGAVSLMPGLLELGVQRIALSGGASASVAVEGRMRALARPGSWLVDVAMSARLDGDQFETNAMAAGTSLFASNELTMKADLGFGRDATGFYLALKPLRVSYLGLALAQVERKLRPGAALTADWGAVSIPLPPFVLAAPSGSVSLDPSNQTVTLSFGAGQLRTASAAWPAGSANTPALQCKWSAGSMTLGKTTVTLAGNDGTWQNDVAGVTYRVTQPSVRVELALGADATASVMAGIDLSGARLQLKTLAQRPDNKEPWVSIEQALPDIDIGVDGRFSLKLPSLSPGADPLRGLREACQKTARSDISLPSVPSVPVDWAPKPVKDAYNAAVRDYNKAKEKLEKVLNDCGSEFPAPPSGASFGGTTLTCEVKRLIGLQ